MSDQLIRAISKDGHIKATAVSTRALTERARQIHKALLCLWPRRRWAGRWLRSP